MKAERIHVDVIPAEARPLQGRHAGLISRIVANLVDAGVVIGILAVAYLGWTGLRLLRQGAHFTRPTPGFAVAFWLASLVVTLYFAGSWTTTGRTYGDQLMGLRVVGRRGTRLRFGWALVRAICCVAFPLGLLWAGISRQHRSVQDVILRTSVIHDWHVRASGSERVRAGSDDPVGPRVDVAAVIADEPHDRHPEPLPRLDGE